MIRFILFIIVLGLLFTFSYTNAQELVVVHYFWHWDSSPTRLDLIMMASFLSGSILGLVFVVPGWIRLKLENRRLRRSLGLLEAERDRLHAEQLGKQPPARPSISPEEEHEEN